MSIFDAKQLMSQVHMGSKSPSEKRRLARRLAERQRKNGAVVPPSPPAPHKPYVPPPPKTPQQTRTIRVARYNKRMRRRIRLRQELAARSGLSELTRRALRPARTAQAPSATEGFPTLVGDSGTAVETHELPSGSKRKTPDGMNTHKVNAHERWL